MYNSRSVCSHDDAFGKKWTPSATATSYYCRRIQQQQPTIASPPLYLVALRLLCSFWMVKGERAEPRSPTLAVCSLKQSNGADHSGIVLVWDYVWSFVVFLAQNCSDLSRLLIFSYFPKSTMFCISISISEKKIFHFPHHLLLCLLRLWACHKQCSTVWVNEREGVVSHSPPFLGRVHYSFLQYY